MRRVPHQRPADPPTRSYVGAEFVNNLAENVASHIAETVGGDPQSEGTLSITFHVNQEEPSDDSEPHPPMSLRHLAAVSTVYAHPLQSYNNEASNVGTSDAAAADADADADADANDEANAEDADEGDICTICRIPLETGDIMRQLDRCGHGFHMQCIDHWLDEQTLCPLCRQVPHEGATNPAPDAADVNAVQWITLPNASSDPRATTAGADAPGADAPGAPDAPDAPDASPIRAILNHSNRLRNLVEIELNQNDTDADAETN